MKPLRRLLGYFQRHRARALLAFLAMAVVAVATVALLFLVLKVVDEVLGAGASAGMTGLRRPAASASAQPLLRLLDGWYAAGRDAARAAGLEVRWAVPGLLFLALLVKNAFSYVSELELNTIGLAMVRDLRRDAYRKLLDQSSRFYADVKTGDLMSRMLSDVEMIQSAFGTKLTDFLQGILSIGFILAFVFSLNAKLTLAVFVVAPIVLLPIIDNARRLYRMSSSSRERIGEMGSILGETLRGQRVIKTYAMEEFEAERFQTANEKYFRVSRRTVGLQALNSPLMEVLAGVGLAAVFVYAAGQIAGGAMTVGGLIAFLAAVMMMYKPLKDVTRTNMALQLALSSAVRLFELIDGSNEIVEKPDAQELPPFSRSLAFSRVTFRYGTEPVLVGVDLVVQRGETVALVGPSGAGKTTLANLLPRLYDATSGSVSFDGVDLRDVTLASLRRQISIVTQETILFDTTVRANIAYGRPDAPEDRVRAAARSACADEFIDRLPQGYDTLVGEDASRLSGGQRQRLAIARALYKDAPILILDEATSQLDAESEALLGRALANLMKGRTTLVIAHRLSTVRRADRIVVLENGRIVESGPHADLLTRNGLYRRLHDMQFFVESEAAAPAAEPVSL